MRSTSEASDAFGAASRRRAKAPATAGAAIDVPDFTPYVLPGSDDRMLVPGAATATFDDASEYEAMAALLASRAATARAPSAHAGNETPVAAPWFPEATTTA